MYESILPDQPSTKRYILLAGRRSELPSGRLRQQMTEAKQKAFNIHVRRGLSIEMR